MFDDFFDLVRECKLLFLVLEIFFLKDFKFVVKFFLEGYKGIKKIFVMDDKYFFVFFVIF